MLLTITKRLAVTVALAVAGVTAPQAAYATMLGEVYDWLALGLGQSDGAATAWHVGDEAVYKSLGWFGANTFTKTVREVDDEYVLISVVHHFGAFGGSNETGEYRIRRTDNKIVMARSLTDPSNYPDFTPREVHAITSEETSVWVPAGYFDCTYIIGDEDGIYEISTCVAPDRVPMDGAVKMSHASHMGSTTYRLTSFTWGSP